MKEKGKMKRITKLFLFVILIAALAVAAPVNLALPAILAASEETETKSPYSFNNQSKDIFTKQQVSVADISGWGSSINTVAGVATTLNTADFTNAVTNLALNKNEYLKYSPTWASTGEREVVLLAQKKKNAVSGSYTSDIITLPANGYFVLSVDYYILGSAETGYFTLVNTASPNDKSKSISLSQQPVSNANPSWEYEYAYTEWTYTYYEYTHTEDADTTHEIITLTSTPPTGYTYKERSPQKTTVTRTQLTPTIDVPAGGNFTLDGGATFITAPAHTFTFTNMETAINTGFIPVTYTSNDSEGHKAGEEKGNAKTKTENAPLDPTHTAYLAAHPDNKPQNNWVGEIYDGYTLKKITDLAVLKSYWQTAYFFVKTDLLESANYTVTVGARLGGNNEFNGVAYFDNFQCWAVSSTLFDTTYNNEKFKWNEKIDLTNKQIETEHGGQYPQKVWYNGNTAPNTLEYRDYFQTVPVIGQGISTLGISNNAIPAALRFADKANFLHTEDGTPHEVMLVATNMSYSGITTKKETNFKPKPHEVYAIQFYVTGAATSYYFRIGNEYTAITAGAYPYHNAWQFCTFFITGDAIDSADKDGIVLGFYVGKPDSSIGEQGWMAIDGFSVTRVSGGYASSNSSADSVNLNKREDSSSPANAYFDKGRAADIYTNGQINTKYPYPLTADSWTVQNTGNFINGIMNTKHTSFGDIPNPGQIPGKEADNNIYMMRNFEAVTNAVATPSFTTTAGETTYISFDAQVRAIVQGANAKKATAVVRYTESVSGQTIELGRISINEGANWQRYQFGIAESALAVARTVELIFEINGSSMVLFMDNISVSTTASAAGGEIFSIHPLKTAGAWTADTGFTYYKTDSGILFENEDGKYTTLTNALSYSAADATYYKLTVTVRGDADYAHIYINGYDGRMSIIKKTNAFSSIFTDYTLYFYNSTAMELTLKIDLGKIDDPDDEDEQNLVPAKIYITKLELTAIEEDEFTTAKEEVDAAAAAEDTTITKAILTTQAETEETPAGEVKEPDLAAESDFFGKNWWYLIPTLITAIAIVTALAGYLFRKLKFNRHITMKGTSYARDVKIEEARKNIKAVKAVKQKVDKNDETIDNNIADDKEEKE
jgi:hypothetical protein